MVARARGQFAARMLPRLILLGLLALTVTALAAEQPNGFGLRRFAGSAGRGSYGGGAVGTCTGADCARRQARDAAVPGMKLATVEESEEKLVDDVAEDEEEEEEEGETGDETAVEEGRGRRKKKHKKGYGKYIMGLVAASKAVMLYIMIHAVAAVAGKALIVAKVALAIAVALALKKMDHKTSYEIVQHPQYSHSQTHSSSIDYDHGSSSGGGYEGGSRRRRRARR